MSLTKSLTHYVFGRGATSFLSVLTCALALLLGKPSIGDSWLPAQEETVYSTNRHFMMKVSPVQSDVGELYRNAKQGSNPFTDSKLRCKVELFRKTGSGRWKRELTGELLNVIRPVRAYISDDGRSIVTVDDFGNPGYQHSLVLYRTDKMLNALRDASIDDFLDKAELRQNVLTSISARNWTTGAEFDFESAAFVITTGWRHKIVLDLETGHIGNNKAK